ncbi:hypothetical protein [Microbacterium karelineae]|uniref:hypothetical protein n=1 Tax=Microbacterium karelineae TaxID=2654283 RepID=UPI0018D471B1|nr:hypothetical protein [Microbacterium karelineae]
MQLAATRIITDDVDALVAFYETVTRITAERLRPLYAAARTPDVSDAEADLPRVPARTNPLYGAPRTGRLRL